MAVKLLIDARDFKQARLMLSQIGQTKVYENQISQLKNKLKNPEFYILKKNYQRLKNYLVRLIFK